MRKKFKHYSNVNGIYINIWYIPNCSLFILKLIILMYLAIALIVLCFFVMCLFLRIPVIKRWKEKKNQAKYLEIFTKSGGNLCILVRAERNTKTFFFCNMDPTWNAEISGQHPVPPEHFPSTFQSRIILQTHLSSISCPNLKVACGLSLPLSRGLGNFACQRPALMRLSCMAAKCETA